MEGKAPAFPLRRRRRIKKSADFTDVIYDDFYLEGLKSFVLLCKLSDFKKLLKIFAKKTFNTKLTFLIKSEDKNIFNQLEILILGSFYAFYKTC